MKLMVIVILAVVGLVLGSFVNAWVWRVRQQDQELGKKKVDQKRLQKLSIIKGRSRCPNCDHELTAKDLIPLFSWLLLRGKCRYCGKPISSQYPVVELSTAISFVLCYTWWPKGLQGLEILRFCLWLAILTGLLALLVYDLRWKLLPNRILYPLVPLGLLFALITVITANNPGVTLLNEIFAVIIGGGIFYGLFQLSDGKWIGGGDVKLGWLLGLVVGTAAKSVLMIFLASLLGSLLSLPLLASHRLRRHSTVPFGPFLIVATAIVMLFGQNIVNWYTSSFVRF